MPQLFFVLPDGSEQAAQAPADWSLMECARDQGIEGVVAECGGGAICGTCHVHVDPEWFAKLEPAGATEEALLDVVPDRGPTSRLACQIMLSEALDGMRVRVPAEQLAL
ncbi:2Fe-2S iron-sulfur cluster-binding protein [Bordetella pseudohinzii]|uniref:(2Fe-2S)-binding protein n=1 Tax=Bordetella pseudohinzii TaxID=1331258 RepID=A0A0J6BRE3_9BORD|nr:2Fe-2S iron-sulfur cluster-binding protein [Bordetella pseudohinzii]ANY17327.1 (2Fe-2S)-binding protein [Bordetella pseudohinzii]KMM24394.1 reductase [Bordetella pseudohinzii]KXA80418.1 (2Fe-2S)-binding protein [Bordetella pseudohinzii]KXA80786.1 (2Fe-2S)-binding protein [Bordetella pseudohinzii]CUI69150.1 Rhodocoxin [Bordetella pseudohinzii]